MAFVYPDNDYCCKVTFHMRKDFRDDINNERELRTHYVDKGDQESLIFYINQYMNTNVKDKRPETPAYIIMPQISSYHIPPY